MAGHVSEIRWDTASDAVSRRLGKLLEFLSLAENEYQELLQLWDFHSNVDQDVADQLFGETATAEQLAMVSDLRAAMLEVHDMYTTSDLGALRKMSS